MFLDLNIIMNKSSTYCVMPHIGLAVQNHGDFCSCNLNKKSWQDNKKQVMHVYSHDMTRMFQSHTRKMLGAQLDHGLQDPSCQVCWDAESVGNSSARQYFNQSFGNVDPLPDQPRVLIIKPGNTCNFACRMCNPMTSSSWYSDGYKLEKANMHSSSWYPEEQSNQVSKLKFNEYTRTFEHIRKSFNPDNLEFWAVLKKWIENLVFIDIYGGEPFLIPALFDLLEHGIHVGSAKHISLKLHTNASIYNKKYMEILSKYKSVKFSVSIDSSDPDQLEYIRHKSDFATVIDNSKKFKKFIDNYPNMFMSISYTVVPFNVFYVDQHKQELESLLAMPLVFNLVTTPEYDVRHLPYSVKKNLTEKIENQKVKSFLQKSIEGCDIEWPKFCGATDLLDKIRNQRFSDVFPEWWKILEPYWVIK